MGGMTITAKVHNHTITLPPELAIAEGAEVQITVPDAGAAPPHRHEWMRKYIGALKDLPEDFAAEHDHYIHGTPKRGTP